jgi:hypothetical protein
MASSTLNPQLLPAQLSPRDDEIQVGSIPGLLDLDAESDMGEVYKSPLLGSERYPRSPGGPIKDSINDSSELMANSKVGTLENWADNTDSPRELNLLKQTKLGVDRSVSVRY